jgi:hypothetical protein
MERGSGIEDRDDRSSDIEMLMTDSFAKINPTDPLDSLNKQSEGSEIDPIPPVH